MNTNYLFSILALGLLVFWLWMFWDMATDEFLPSEHKLYWVLGFLFLNIITAIYYYLTRYRAKHRI